MKHEEWLKTDEGKASTCYHICSRPVTPEKLAKAYEIGMIAKKDLEDGFTYVGDCRNASEAVWHADKQRFTYIRHKFGSSFDEDIVHPEDDEGFDIFVPMRKK
jgi:hypothetical protein